MKCISHFFQNISAEKMQWIWIAVAVAATTVQIAASIQMIVAAEKMSATIKNENRGRENPASAHGRWNWVLFFKGSDTIKLL